MEKNELNVMKVIETKRKDGSVRVQWDYSNCPTMAEQHTAHLTNLNYLINKYKPDELAAYMAARESYRQEILGHDFSREPELQDSMNHVLILKQNFEALPEDIKINFKNAVEFYKFIDNPANQEKMIKLGLLKRDEIDKLTTDPRTPTQEKDTVKE